MSTIFFNTHILVLGHVDISVVVKWQKKKKTLKIKKKIPLSSTHTPHNKTLHNSYYTGAKKKKKCLLFVFLIWHDMNNIFWVFFNIFIDFHEFVAEKLCCTYRYAAVCVWNLLTLISTTRFIFYGNGDNFFFFVNFLKLFFSISRPPAK